MNLAGPSASAASTRAPLLSVAIITKNEAHRIARCIHSVAFADEIIVLDSGSTDRTVELAEELGATVMRSNDWPGFGVQKNRALAACRGHWVLSIDADETLSPALADSIGEVLAGAPERAADGYWIKRRSTFCGRPIRFGLWRNDRVLRLFKRERGRFSDDLVHERVIVDGRCDSLDGWLLHDSVDSIDDARAKALRYAELGAVRLRERGRGGLLSAWLHASWTFARGYLLKLGWLDGRAGFWIAWFAAWSTFLRYKLAGQAQIKDQRR